MTSVSERRGSGKPRPKSEGFELYNNSAQNGSPESPQTPWAEYSEPKKLPGDDRLMKHRADHRSSPNVASEGALWPFPRPAPHTSAHHRGGGPLRGRLVNKECSRLRRLANWGLFLLRDVRTNLLTGAKSWFGDLDSGGAWAGALMRQRVAGPLRAWTVSLL